MKKIAIIMVLTFFLASLGLAADEAKENELLFMARKAYEDGFYEVSLGMLERLEKGYSGSTLIPPARLLAGQCYFYQGRYLEALRIFEDLLNNPAAGQLTDAAYFWMGEVHFKGGNFERSALLYQKLIEKFPQSSYTVPAYYSLGWAFAQSGKFKLALQTFQTLIASFPQEPQSKDAAFKLIECLYNLKEYSDLKTRIRSVLKLYSNDLVRLPYLYFYLAEAEYYLERPDEAAKNYLKAVQGFSDPTAKMLAKLGLGWSYLKLAKYKEAESIFMEIDPATLDSKSREVFLLGDALLMSATNRVFEARKLYEQLIDQSSDPVTILQAYLGKGDAHYNLAEYSAAAKTYQTGLDRIKKEGLIGNLPQELVYKLQYNLAGAYLKSGQVGPSLEISESLPKAKEPAMDRTSLLFQIAQAYEVSGDLSKAEDIYDKISKTYPEPSDLEYAQYQSALIQVKKGELPKAIAALESWIEKYSQSKLLPDAFYQLATIYFQLKDYARCSQLLQKFKDIFRGSRLQPQALYLLGFAAVNSGKINEALETFNLLIKLDLSDLDLLQKVEYEIADCYYKLGQEAEAARRFKLLRSKYPDSRFTANIMWWLGQYYYRNKDFDLARRHFDALIKDYPESPLKANAYFALGLILGAQDKLDEAIESFKTAINLGGSDLRSQSLAALADLYDRLDRPQEALEQYGQIVKNDPQLSRALFPQIAQAYYRAGNYEEAKKFYFKCLEINPQGPEAGHLRFSLAEVLEADGKTEEALRQYILAADLFTGDPGFFVRTLLRAAKLYEDQDDLKEALKIYKRIIEHVPTAPEAGFIQEKIEGIKSASGKNQRTAG